MLGSKILEARKLMGMTISQLSQQTGISTGHISQIERNEMEPSLTVLRKLAVALCIPMNVLFDQPAQQSVIYTKGHHRPLTTYRSCGIVLEDLSPPLLQRQAEAALTVLICKIPMNTRLGREILPMGYEALAYVLAGQACYQIGDRDVILNPGDSVYVPNNTGYCIVTDGGSTAEILWAGLPTAEPAATAGNKIATPEPGDGTAWRVAGERIRRFRTEQGLTVTALAEAAGISAAQISRIERDVLEPTLPTLRNICAALNIEILSLISQGFPADMLISTAADPNTFQFSRDESIYLFMTPSEVANHRQPALSAFLGTLKSGLKASQLPALHPNKSELMYVQEGTAQVLAEDELYTLEQGDSLYLDRGVPHYMINASESTATLFSFFA